MAKPSLPRLRAAAEPTAFGAHFAATELIFHTLDDQLWARGAAALMLRDIYSAPWTTHIQEEIAMAKKALIVWGGWDGHTPEQSARFVGNCLRGTALTSISSRRPRPSPMRAGRVRPDRSGHHHVADREGGADQPPGRSAGGTGIAGFHGLMCDSFRNEPTTSS